MNNTISVILSAVDQLSGPLGAAGKRLDDFGAKAESIGQKLESAGLRIGGLGAAGQVALSRVGLDLNTLAGNAINAEQALYGIANTAGLSGGQAKAMVGEWTIAMNRLATETNKSQDEITTAFQDLIAKGMDPQVAIAQLGAIGKAATAAGADVRDMASAANAGLQNMGVDASRSLEIMAQAGKSGAFELRDMAAYFDLLTVKASLLGQKGPQGMASLAAAAQIARKGAGDASTAANNLANFLDKLTAPVTAEAFEKFGVNLGDEVKKGLASGDLIGFMAERIQQVTGGDAAKLSQLFADVQAKNFIAPMLQNLDEYKRIRDESLGASGVVDQDFATAMQSTAAQLDAMKANAAAAVNSSGALKDMVDALRGLSAWVAENPELAKWAIFGTAGMAVGGAALVGIGATVTAIGSISTALSGMAAFLAANPAVAAILGVAASFTAGFAFGTWLSGQIDKAVQAVTGDQFATLGTKLYDLVQWFKELPARVKAAIGNLAEEMKKIGSQIIDGLVAGVKARAKAFSDSITGAGKDAYLAVKDFFGIRSPSRLMAEVGENISQGVAVGIEAGLPDVQQAADKLAEVVAVTSTRQPRNADGSFKSRADADVHGTGALGGIKEYMASIQDVAAKTKDIVANSFKGMEDALVNFVKTGKLDFKSLADSILSDMARIAVQQSITKPLAGALSSFNWASMFGFAQGGAPGGVSAWRNQIVDRPTFFAFARGGVMGEAGPEAIMPLKRGPDGTLGVRGGGSNVTVNVVNNANGTQATARERNEGGNRIIDVMIEQVKGAIAGDIARGAGPIPGALATTYGLNRVAGAY